MAHMSSLQGSAASLAPAQATLMVAVAGLPFAWMPIRSEHSARRPIGMGVCLACLQLRKGEAGEDVILRHHPSTCQRTSARVVYLSCSLRLCPGAAFPLCLALHGLIILLLIIIILHVLRSCMSGQQINT